MTRRRTTDHKASAPPATPGYAEGTNHPAWPGPDPDADKYMNGDPSSWAEDPHPGPYPNTPPPADPGMQEPQGHPATDPAHYFPGGAGKAASRQLRAAMTQKAAKCIRIATAMLPKNASVDAIEDQALDLMSLGDRQIQAMLGRLGEKDANYTLTPERKADDLLADDMIVDDEDVVVPAAKKAEDEKPEEKEAKKGEEDEDDAEKKAAKYARLAAYWSKKAKAEDEEETEKEAKKGEEDEETEKEAKKAAAARKAAPSGNQNDPAHYNYEGTDLGKNKTATEDEEEEEAMLAEMMEEEAKKAAAAKSAKKGEDEPFGGKKAPPFEKKDDADKKAKKADEDEEKKSEDDDADKEAKKAKKADDEDEESEKEAKKGEEEETEKEASLDMVAGMDDPFGDDPMALMDPSTTDSLSEDEMVAVYGARYAGKKKADEDEESDKEAKKAKKGEEDEESEKEGLKHVDPKAASLKPQARTASTGPRTLGSIPGNNRTASAEINDLSKLWESAPDVSKVFGG